MQATTASAISSAVLIGCEKTMSGTFSRSSPKKPVSTGPGETTETLIRRPRHCQPDACRAASDQCNFTAGHLIPLSYAREGPIGYLDRRMRTSFILAAALALACSRAQVHDLAGEDAGIDAGADAAVPDDAG